MTITGAGDAKEVDPVVIVEKGKEIETNTGEAVDMDILAIPLVLIHMLISM